jgi:hypothetical protein
MCHGLLYVHSHKGIEANGGEINFSKWAKKAKDSMVSSDDVISELAINVCTI